MSKKSFTLFTIALLIIIGVAFWYFFFRPSAGILGPDGTANDPDLFPFGQGQVTPIDQGTTTPTDTTIDLSGGVGADLPRLRKLWSEPVAGATFVSSGTDGFVRFVDRATGHIYDSLLDVLGERKVSNVTVPQIYEALWAPSGREVVLRYLKDDETIQSFYGSISPSATTSTSSPLEGYFLTPNIREVAALGNRLLYVNPTISTGNIIVSGMNGGGKASVMSSGFKEWLISWNNPATAFITSRPSGTVPGFGYLLNISNGSLTKIADAILGLTGTINPQGTRVFMSAHDRGGIASASYVIADKSLETLSIKTLSDKCAWSSAQSSVIYCAVPNAIPRGTYPDDWYQGSVSFDDRLWKIDLETGETDVVLDPEFETLEKMDIFKISIAPQDAYIIFTNKKDMSLWLYALE